MFLRVFIEIQEYLKKTNVQEKMTEEKIRALLQLETETERQLLDFPEIIQGLNWGVPRFGHPEGKVVYHVLEIFNNLDSIRPSLSVQDRQILRLVTILHDTFKYDEDKTNPRDWSKHHSALAADFAEKFFSDTAIIDIIRRHDDAYYSWKLFLLQDQPEQALKLLDLLLDKVGYCLQLYYIFFICDTATGDKTQAPVKWFEQNVSGLQKVLLINN